MTSRKRGWGLLPCMVAGPTRYPLLVVAGDRVGLALRVLGPIID